MEDALFGARPGIGHVLGQRPVLLTEHPSCDGALKADTTRAKQDPAETGEDTMLYFIDATKPVRVQKVLALWRIARSTSDCQLARQSDEERGLGALVKRDEPLTFG